LGIVLLVKVQDLKRANVREIDISVLPDGEIIGKLPLEQSINYPGDIIVIGDKSYITVEKVNHYYFDGAMYKFAKTVLSVRPLTTFH